MTADFERVDDYRWRIPRHGGMRVPGLVFSSEAMLSSIADDRSLIEALRQAVELASRHDANA